MSIRSADFSLQNAAFDKAIHTENAKLLLKTEISILELIIL
jgi:hypothetical protein